MWIGPESAATDTDHSLSSSFLFHRYLFALEDPFETTHNVARTCNGSGMPPTPVLSEANVGFVRGGTDPRRTASRNDADQDARR